MIKYFRFSALFLVLVAIVSKTQLLVIGSLLIYMIWMFYNKRFLLKYLYVLFLIMTNILGVLVIEYSSINLYELGQISKEVNSLAPIVLVHLIFIEILVFFDNKYESKQEKLQSNLFSNHSIYTFTFISTIIITILLVIIIDKPYFLLGFDRFDYQKNILNPLQTKIGNLVLYFMPIFYLTVFKKRTKLGLMAIILFNIYFLWIGHKFSIFIMAFQLGLLAIYKYIKTKELNKYLLWIGLVLSIFITVVIIQNITIRDIGLDKNIAYMKSRLAQQGQLWWGIYKHKEYHQLHLEDAKKELELFFIPNANDNEKKYQLGMYKTMRLVAPANKVEFKIKQGSRYAYSTQANLLYYFNYPILILFSALMAYILAKITNSLINNILRSNIINIIVLSKLYINYIRVLTNSDFHTIFSIETLIILTIVLLTDFYFKLQMPSMKFQLKYKSLLNKIWGD